MLIGELGLTSDPILEPLTGRWSLDPLLTRSGPMPRQEKGVRMKRGVNAHRPLRHRSVCRVADYVLESVSMTVSQARCETTPPQPPSP